MNLALPLYIRRRANNGLQTAERAVEKQIRGHGGRVDDVAPDFPQDGFAGEGGSVEREATPQEYRVGRSRPVDLATPKEYRPPFSYAFTFPLATTCD